MTEGVDKKKLAGALQDVRKMRRAVRLRKNEDPEVVAETLSTILREAIAVRSASGGRLGKGAVNEIRNIRRDLTTGQIGAGQRSAEFTGKYSAILDQIGDIEKESSKKQKVAGGAGSDAVSAVKRNLPSADMLTAALTTANPVLGYTTKIASDLFKSRGQKKKAAKDEELQRMKNLQMEEQGIKEQMKENQEGIDDTPGKISEQHELAMKLDLIKEEIQRLNENITGGTNEKLEKISDINQEELNTIQERESRESLLEREREFESGGLSTSLDSSSDAGGSSLLFLPAGMRAAMAAVGVFMGGVALKMFKPFVAILGIFKKGATLFRGLGRLTLVTAGLFAAYDLAKGFMDAEKILGRDGLSISEKFSAAFANVITGLLEPINWAAEKLGFEGWDRQELTKKIAEFGITIKGFIMKPFSWIGERLDGYSFADFYADMRMALTTDNIKEFLMTPINWTKDYIDNFNFEETINDIKSAMGGVFDSFTETFNNMANAIEGWINEKVEDFKNSWIGKRISDVADFFTNERPGGPLIYPSHHPMHDSQSSTTGGSTSESRIEGATSDTSESRIEEPSNNRSDVIRRALQGANEFMGSGTGGDRSSVNVAAPVTNNVGGDVIHQHTSPPNNEDPDWKRMTRGMNIGAY